MPKVLVLYYSSYGHMEQMANAAAEGARQAGAQAVVKRVPELVSEEMARKSGYKVDQAAPVATVEELPSYGAVILGIPTRYGRMPAQMANFLDQTGGLWATGALNGKVGSVMSSTATQHGGQETTLFSGITNLLHLGMVIVGLLECAPPAGQAESLRLTRELGFAGVRPWLVIASTVSRSRSRSCRSTRPGRRSTPWHVSTTSRAP